MRDQGALHQESWRVASLVHACRCRHFVYEIRVHNSIHSSDGSSLPRNVLEAETSFYFVRSSLVKLIKQRLLTDQKHESYHRICAL